MTSIKWIPPKTSVQLYVENLLKAAEQFPNNTICMLADSVAFVLETYPACNICPFKPVCKEGQDAEPIVSKLKERLAVISQKHLKAIWREDPCK